MTFIPPVSAGTIDLANGSTTVSGLGTNFLSAGAKGGDILVIGVTRVEIQAVISNTRVELLLPWEDSDIAGGEFYIVSRNAETLAAENATEVRRLLQQIRTGLLSRPDAFGTLQERSQFDNEPAGFVYNVLDEANEAVVGYYKTGPTASDWSVGITLRGEPGIDGQAFDFKDSGIPDNSLGEDGQDYLNRLNGDVYIKSSGVWVLTSNIVGVGDTAELDTMRVLWLADTQPRADGVGSNPSISERGEVQRVFSQIGSNPLLSSIDLIRHNGDIVHHGSLEASDPPDTPIFAEFIEDTRLTRIPWDKWSFIRGNHDRNYNSDDPSQLYLTGFDQFEKCFGWEAPSGYRRQGNFCEFWLSTESNETAGSIPDYQIEDLRSALRKSKDAAIFVLNMHHPLQNTTAGSETLNGAMAESQRIIDLLDEDEDFPNIVVMAGHTGLNNVSVLGAESHVQITTPGGKTIDNIQVGLHIGGYADRFGTAADHDMSFIVGEFVNGLSSVRFRRWNTRTETFLDGDLDHDVTIPLAAPLILPRNEQINTRKAAHPAMRNTFRDVQTIVMQPDLIDPNVDGVMDYKEGPTTVARYMVTDTLGTNLKDGLGVRIAYGTPRDASGRFEGTEQTTETAYFDVVRENNAETTRAVKASLSVSDVNGVFHKGYEVASNGVISFPSGVDFGDALDVVGSANPLTMELADAASGGNRATEPLTGSWSRIGDVVTFQVTDFNIVTTGMIGSNVLHIERGNLPLPAGQVAFTTILTSNLSSFSQLVTRYQPSGDMNIYELPSASFINVDVINSGRSDLIISGSYIAA